jgi:2-haloacid dehalogenase
MTIRVCVFDAYGTLFDVAAAARAVAKEPQRGALAGNWAELAEDWRRKQLEYSWLRAITGDHVPFWEVTKDALDWAMDRAGLADPELRERLLALYWELAPYREVPFALAALKARGLACAILSNGSPAMLEGAVDSAGIGEYLDAVLSVETIGVFKPARGVYDMVGARFDCAASEVLFVSANGWDAAAAAAYGFRTVWVNRAGLPPDRLMAQPAHVLHELSAVPELV